MPLWDMTKKGCPVWIEDKEMEVDSKGETLRPRLKHIYVYNLDLDIICT